MPAAVLTNTKSFPLPPPFLLSPVEGTGHAEATAAGGTTWCRREPGQARLHPHRGEEEQRHGVTQRHSEELLHPPGWHLEGGSGAGGAEVPP